jgi:hypothetical protein
VSDQVQDETETPSPYDVAVERTKRSLARNPQISAADFFVRFLEPLLEEIRSEYAGSLEAIEETLESLDIPDEDALEQAKQLILMLGNLVDNTFARVGWIDATGTTEQMPADIEKAFRQAADETRSFFERLAELEDEEDDEDEEEEADEEAEAEANAGAAEGAEA